MSTDHSERRHPNFKDLAGHRFGFLVVLKEDRRRWKGKNYGRWSCRCDCGAFVTVEGTHLRNGHTKSCGCAKPARIAESRTKHGAAIGRRFGHRETTEFRIWEAIRQRCLNESCPAYRAYGGRGIVICAAWRSSFSAFLADVGFRPSKDVTLDRRDNDKGYTCGKCSECTEKGWQANWRWATRQEQANNRRSNVVIEWRGRKMNLKQWAAELRISYMTLYLRIRRRNWSIEKAFTTPSLTPS